MNNIIDLLGDKNKWIHNQADEIVKKNMIRLLWSNVYLISAQTEIKDVGYLYALTDYIRNECDRIVVLTLESEFTHLVVATSNNVCSININEILRPLIKKYNGQIEIDREGTFVHVSFYQQDVAPKVIDYAIESIIVTLPYM